MQKLTAIWRCWLRLDWRIKAVIVPIPAGGIISWAIWWWGYGHDPSTFFGAVFAAWVGGFILYLVIGSIVAVVSLSHPESESFDARARILFRRQTGKHIDYIIGTFQSVLEHYTESSHVKIKFVAYDEDTSKVLLCGENETYVRAYIDDIDSTFRSYIEYKNIVDCPQNKEENRIVYLRINGEPQSDCSVSFVKTVKKPYHVNVAAGKACKISRCSLVWSQCPSEDNTHTPSRYTQSLTLEFENQLPNEKIVKIELSTNKGILWDNVELRPGESKVALRRHDALPSEEIYRYRVTVS